MVFSLTILGCSSAVPTSDRFPTSQLLAAFGRYYLIDCGEGTQIQLRKYGISFQRIDHIFISHMHADHFLGLPGLLSTMDLLGRTREIHIYGPAEVEDYIQQYMRLTHHVFSFPVMYHPLASGSDEVLFENRHLYVQAFPLKHSVPCHGFLFRQKPPPLNIRKEMIDAYSISIEEIIHIKQGSDLTLTNGTIIPNAQLTHPAPALSSYAFITDTAYFEPVVPYITGVTVLYHESTFGDDLKERAKSTRHSTAKQAASIAKLAGASKLLLGHYSVRYRDTTVLQQQAQEIFPDTLCSYEGFQIQF